MMHSLRMQPFQAPERAAAAPKPLKYRMLLVGAQGVGKYSLHHQFVYSVFPPIRDPFFDSEPTELSWKGSDDEAYVYQVNPARMNISKTGDKIDDQSNGEQFYPNTVVPLQKFRFSEANGMVLVYSITSRSSFEALQRFVDARIKDANAGVSQPKVICVVGNKLDYSRDKRKVLCIEGEELASKLDCSFVECSAKDQKGLDKTKSTLIKALGIQRDVLIRASGEIPTQNRERKRLVRTSSYNSTILRRASDTSGLVRSDTQLSSSSDERDSARQTTGAWNGANGGRQAGGQVAGFGTVPRYQSNPKARSLHSDHMLEQESDTHASRSSSPALTRAMTDTKVNEKGSQVREASRSRWQFGSKEARQTARPDTRNSQTSSDGGDKPKPAGISITPPAQVASLGTLFQYKPPPKKKVSPPLTQHQRLIGQIKSNFPPFFPVDKMDPLNPHPGTKVPLPSSVPASRRQSLELTAPGVLSSGRLSPALDTNPSTNRTSEEQPVSDTPQLEPISPPALQPLDFMSLPRDMQPDAEAGSADDGHRKLDWERARLEEEKQKLRDQMVRLAEQKKKMLERRKLEEERRKIEAERKKIEEERRKIEKEVAAMEEESRRMAEDEMSWDEDLQQRLQAEREEMVQSPTSIYSRASFYGPMSPQEEAPVRREMVRSNSEDILSNTMDLVTINPNRLSKDDSFLEPPPRNPARSASRLGFRSPQLSPSIYSSSQLMTFSPPHAQDQEKMPTATSTNQGKDRAANAAVTSKATSSSPIEDNRSSRSSHMRSTIDSFNRAPKTNAAPAPGPVSPKHFPFPRSMSENGVRSGPSSPEPTTAPYVRSMSDSELTTTSTTDSIASSITDDGSVKTFANSPTDYTARVIRINRVSRTFDGDSLDTISALPQSKHNGISYFPPEKQLSLAERLKRRDEEDKRDHGGWMNGNGYAVRATTLPPIIEHEAQWTETKPRLPFPGRYI